MGRNQHLRDIIRSHHIRADAVVASDVADGAVTTDKLGANAVTSAKLATSTIQTVTHTVTSAELLALNATPQQIVAAPEGGNVLVVVDWAISTQGGVPYSGIAGGEDLAIKYTDASGAKAGQDVEVTGFLDQPTPQIRLAAGVGGLAANVTPVDGAALVLHMLTGEITSGNYDLKVTVNYRVVNVQ